MKKLLAALMFVVMVVSCLMLCACDVKAVKPKQVLVNNYDETLHLLSAMKEVNITGDVKTSKNNLVLLESVLTAGTTETTKLTVYNIEENKAVYTAEYSNELLSTTSCKVNIKFYGVNLDNATVFSVSKNISRYNDATAQVEISGQTELYLQNGDKIAESKSEEVSSISYAPSVKVVLDLVIFNDVAYRVANGKEGYFVEAELELDELRKYNWDLDAKTQSYYYSFDEDGALITYNKYLDLVDIVGMPSYGEDVVYGIIDDGIVLVQYLVALPSGAEEYDCYKNGTKYNIVTQTYNVKTHKKTNVECNYRIDGILGKCCEEQWNTLLGKFIKNVDVIASVHDIAGKHIDESDYAQHIVIMDKKGNVKSILSDIFVGMKGIPVPIATDRYVCETLDNHQVLINSKGEVVCEVDNVQGYNNNYIVSSKIVYDRDHSELMDLQKNGLSYYASTKELLFLTNADGEVFSYNGVLNQIISKTEAENGKSINVQKDYYAVINAVPNVLGTLYNCSYYNAAGELILQTNKLCTLKVSYNGNYLFAATDSDGNTIYYRAA